MIDFVFRPNCIDCGVDTAEIREYYMIRSEVWLGAGMKHDHEPGDGMLCIGCLENRIGRRLVASDFPDYPINRGAFRQSDRLRNRMSDDTTIWRY